MIISTSTSVIMKRLDVIILGATGFSGAIVVKSLIKLNLPIKWGIAGRSKEKLNNLLKEIESTGGNVSNIPVFIADAKISEDLCNVAKETKILLNCVGPNTLYSERIVQACLNTNTHYIDLSAEINHILDLYRKYHKEAEKAKVLVIPSCGFASLIVASGYLYLEEQFQGTLSTVDCYAELHIPKRAYIPWPGNCLVHYGTWESTVHAMRNMKEFMRLKKETFPEPIEKSGSEKGFFHRHNGKLWFPYPGPEDNVMEMSHRYVKEKNPKKPMTRTNCYTTMPCFFHYIIIPVMFLYYYLCHFEWFSKLLWKFPRLFTLGYVSHKGPSEKMLQDMGYSFTMIGTGWDQSIDVFTKPENKKVTVKVSSYNPYEATNLAMIYSALTLLMDQNKMPEGGVVNVGAVFRGTELVKRLADNGINYEVLVQ